VQSMSMLHVRTLGLKSHLPFLKGDAFDALDTYFSQMESIDLLYGATLGSGLE